MSLRLLLLTLLVACCVVGQERFVSTQTQPPSPYFITDLGTLGGAESRAFGVSEAADTVGSSLVADGTSHAFLFSGTTLTDLGTLGGASVATGLNGGAEVVGY